MIAVQLNKRDFEYDIHSLVKAFYPGEDVSVLCGETGEDAKLKISVFFEEKEGSPESTDQCRESAEKCERTQEGKESRGKAQEEQGAVSCRKEADERDAKDYGGCRISVAVRLPENQRPMEEKCVTLREDADRKEAKNQLKRLLYQLLRDFTGQELPWGTLTGIRPTKIPMMFLEQGWRNVDIARYMRDTYYTSSEKTALAVSIANRERHILKDINYENGYSLYVGIPFCPSICLYCSFSSSPIHLWRNQVDTYLDALCHEIDAVSELFAGRELNTVYIGGGTPTTLEPEQMERLLKKLEERFAYSHLREFTVEAGRPDSITREKLQVLRAHGISRISINPQTMNQKTLDIIGRRHTVEETVAAFRLARSMGFDNINMDLIVGLPGEGIDEVRYTMEELRKLEPDSVTVHSLALKRATRLNLFKEEYREISFQNSSEIMDMTARYCQQMGMAPYYLYRQKNMAGNFENVGYAREGKAGIYNILIMEEVQSILALGAGASTKLVWPGNRIQRIENVKDIKNYMERIDEMIERKKKMR